MRVQYPTLAQLTGSTDHVPSTVDGISVLPTILGEETTGRKQQARENLPSLLDKPAVAPFGPPVHPSGARC